MWSCVEHRNSSKSGRITKALRQIVFKDIYADRTAIKNDAPIATSMLKQIKAGAPIAYYDNCGKICEGSFLCTGKQFEDMNPIDIIAEVLNSDDEIRKFCKDNNLGDLDDHIFK